MKYIISTRPAEKFSPVSSRCFDVVNCPLTGIRPLNIDYEGIMKKYDVRYIVFTSSVGADIFFRNVGDYAAEYLAIGKNTADAIRSHGHECIVPDEKDSKGLAEKMIRICRNGYALLLRSSMANEELNRIIEGKVRYIDVRTYDVIERSNEFENMCMSDDCIGALITSSMEAGIAAVTLKKTGKMAFAIGGPTAEALEQSGIKPAIVGDSDFAKTIEKIERVICRN